MTNPMPRRRFFEATAAAGLAAGAVRTARAGEPGPNDTVVVGIMGTGIRGLAHSRSFARLQGAEVAYVCDVDERRAAEAAERRGEDGRPCAEAVGDFRRILDDKGVDALIIATCNHWHAPAAILACAAGKHVYVEKPCSHNPREGELLIEAARKYDRVMQMGNQRRSWPKIIEAVEQVRDGAIGRPYFAQSYFYNKPRLDRPRRREAPSRLARLRPLARPRPASAVSRQLPALQLALVLALGQRRVRQQRRARARRLPLGPGRRLPHPRRLLRRPVPPSMMTRRRPTPTTVGFEFGPDRAITWQGISCNAARVGGSTFDIIIEGTEGAIRINGAGYTVLDLQNKVVKEVSGQGGDAVHLANFVAAIQGEAELTSEIAEGHRSTLLCHLANIAHRTGHVLDCDPKTGRIRDDDAMSLWSREYASGWEPKV